MSKILVWTDLHLDNYRPFSSVLPGGINSRIYDQILVVNQVKNLAKQEKVDAIIFLGDLINPMGEGLSKSVYNAVFYTASRLAAIAPSYFLVGNHDIYRGVHVLAALDSIENCYVVKDTSRVTIAGMDIDLVPWNQPFPSVSDRAPILMGHSEIEGCQVHAGVPYVGGRSAKDLAGYERVYLGHFHTRQSIPVPDAKEALYIGAVMACNFNDSTEDRGAYIYSGEQLVFHPIVSPKFRVQVLSSVDEYQGFLSAIDDSKDFWRVTIKDPKITPDPRPGVQYVYDIHPQHQRRMEISQTESILTIIKRFIAEANWKGDKEEATRRLDDIGKEAGVF